MATNRAGGVLGRLRGAAAGGGTDRPPDRELLDRFVLGRDPAAFDALLARHGPMVLAVCRRTLPDPAAAEDAFQATFLVLLRKAGSLGRGELLGNWLYGVACRTAARARVDAARRRRREGGAPPRTPADPLADISARELVAAVDEELLRLPPRYRVPVVACYLEGKTRDEAAAELGWSPATLGRRLARGRDLLRARLAHRGLALSAALLPASLATAVVPSSLSAPVRTAAGHVAGGQAVPLGVIPGAVETLSRRVVGAMFIGKLTTTAAMLLAAGLVLLGVGSLAHGVIPGRPTAAVTPKAADPPPRPVKDIERDIEAKPKPDVTLLPPTGGHVILAATSADYDAYEAAAADGKKTTAADLIDRGRVVLVAEPVDVIIKKRGKWIDYVTPVDGPHAGRTWAIAATGLPRK